MIVIRACSGFDELEACVQLQIETWGMDASEVFPRKAFLLAQKIGGQVIGAFDTELAGTSEDGGPESLVGFALSWPGVKTDQGEPRPYLHSHMLAVREEYRNRGLGTQTQAGAAPRGSPARHPADGVDLRSAGDQERLSQHPQAGSRLPAGTK